jgi:hypothetical protein
VLYIHQQQKRSSVSDVIDVPVQLRWVKPPGLAMERAREEGFGLVWFCLSGSVDGANGEGGDKSDWMYIL